MQTTEPDIRQSTFRARHVPDCSDSDWASWHWQVQNRILSLDELSDVMVLSSDELEFFENYRGQRLPFAVTPYYLSLIDPDEPEDALRRCIVPTCQEYGIAKGDMDDPLGEDAYSPVPGIVYKYPDRVLLLVEHECPTYCRYCTRGRAVGRSPLAEGGFIENAVAYIRDNPQIHDVLISGGEPLLASDQDIDALLRRLSNIPHLDYIRIGTKVPMTLPQRITPELCQVLKRHAPVFISLHATHSQEFTVESREACNRLADAGIPLGSQTVLLKGVNDSAVQLIDLFRGLLRMRVKPYYLLLCDPVTGSSHFRVPVDRGVELIGALQGRLSGYGIPKLILDIPGGGGKVPLAPAYITGADDDSYLLSNYEGKDGFTYPKN